MLLIVVLLIITLLALVATTFSFKMHADLAAVKARQDNMQAEQAARAGIDRAIKLLRDQRVDIEKWYNNDRYFRRTLIWAPDKLGGSESLADQEPIPGQPAWRVSVVSYQILGNDVSNNSTKIRYGVTDEASKININTASRAQLLLLFDQIRPEDVTSEQLADALLDWRDADDTLTSIHGAESSYYLTLNPPYRAKNRPFETVEELLMVKGFNGRILYGEDYNRNGYLDPNEDDGPEGAFPYDNGDNKLDRGLLPYLTVYSWDWNLSNDNKRRAFLNRDFDNPDKLPEQIKQDLRPEVIDFIAEARKRGYRFKSVGELMGLEVFEDGSSNYDDAWRSYVRQLFQTGRVRDQDRPEPEPSDDQPGDDADGGDRGSNRGADNRDDGRDSRDGGRDGDRDSRDDNRDTRDGGRDSGRDDRDGDRNGPGTDRRGDDRDSRDAGGRDDGRDQRNDSDDRRDDNRDSGQRRGRTDRQLRGLPAWAYGDSEVRVRLVADVEQGDVRRNQSIGDSRDDLDGGRRSGPRPGRSPGGNAGTNDDNGRRGSSRGQNNDAGDPQDDAQDQDGGDRRRGGRGRDRDDNRGGDRGPGRGRDGDRGQDGRRDDGDRGGRGGDGPGGGRGRGTPVTSPVTPEDMPVLMDRLTANPVPATAGLINVNTALPVVIRSIPGLTPEQADMIVAKRAEVDPALKNTTAWLVTSGAVDPETFALISNQITTRSIQFTIDSIGFADHTGAFKRLQAVVEMRGQLAQIKYYRDISSLGMGYPVRDDERSEGFAFDR